MDMAVLQHVPFEGPAAIASWAALRSIGCSISRLYAGDALPDPARFDMLTVMGGPMSANDEASVPWLSAELQLVRACIAAGKIVFGVCLGAQLIAKALGARVYAGSEKEIGWFAVRRTPAASPLFAALPQTFTPLHWHGETFDLPRGAERLAASDATPNQAFAVGDRILGLQFHLEATIESVDALVRNAAQDIGAGHYQQAASEILNTTAHFAANHRYLACVLDSLTGQSRAGT